MRIVQMASGRKSRFALPPDPAKVLRDLRACRDSMVGVRRHVIIGGPAYRAADGISKAIDDLAYVLTGDREYFWEAGSGANEAQRKIIEDKMARERGEVPWS